jgi:RND family efflux transporter MFP subunit
MKHTDEIPKHLPKVSPHVLRLIAVCVVLALGAVFILGFWIHHERVAKREKMAEEMRNRKPVVLVVRPKATQKSFELRLPADIRAFAATSLYARTNGYLASWTVDINDRVKKGDVMAVIAAPDTDADLEQAQAALNQQQTNYKLTDVTAERYNGLVAVQGVTQQQLDQFNSAREQAKAGVVSSAASVDRLKALVGFEKIIAPFDGVVTARNYDLGALISATNIGPGQQLFDVAEDDKLRVFVNIPQTYAYLVQYGQDVELALERNYPGHRFKGLLSRSAGSLDPVTRTLRTELDFQNNDPAGHLFPGMYGEAIFEIHREKAVLTIPTSALLFEADGKQVAVVDQDNKVHFQKILPGNDFGTEIEALAGLKGDERIVANPGLGLGEGVVVSPQEGTGGGPAPAEPSEAAH